jgi:hypothetical protein
VATTGSTSGSPPAAGASGAISTLLLGAGLAAAAAGAFVAAGGGLRLDVGGLRVSARSPWLALVAAAVFLVASAALRSRGATVAAQARDEALPKAAPCLAALVALGVFVTGLTLGSTVAGGADSSGYISQAARWRAGSLVVAEPLIAGATWPDAARTFSPLGYVPGRSPGTIVPSYPPGLPLQFALATLLGGNAALAVVVPLLGSLAVWVAYVLGRRLDGPLAGLVGSVLLAASPPFLAQLLQPMSDVPVTAWWAATLALLASARPRRLPLAGLAAGIAVMTRPNLVPLLAVLVPLVAWPLRPGSRPQIDRGRAAGTSQRLVLFLAGLILPLVLLALFNTRMYGAPWASGYGDASQLFTWPNVLPNLRRYGAWLVETHAPLVGLAIAGGLVTLLRPAGPAQRPLAMTLVAFTAVTLACYLPYAAFESSAYLRFLLPAIAVAAVLAGAAWRRLAGRLPVFASALATAVALGLVAGWGVKAAREDGAFDIARREVRYRAAAEWIRDHTSPDTLVLAAQHSGSVHHTAGRTVVRWDLLDPRPFPGPNGPEAALDTLLRRRIPDAAGRRVALVVDADEAAAFRARFGASELGALDWPPWAATGPPSAVRIYRAEDRAAYLADGVARTIPIAVPAQSSSRR